MTIIIIMPSYKPPLAFPLALGEEMAGTVSNISTNSFPVGFNEEMSGTVSNTSTNSFPIDVSD